MPEPLSNEERAAIVYAESGVMWPPEDVRRHLDDCSTCSAIVRTVERIVAARESAAAERALRDAANEWEGGPTGAAPIPRWWLHDRAAAIAAGRDTDRSA